MRFDREFGLLRPIMEGDQQCGLRETHQDYGRKHIRSKLKIVMIQISC